MLTSDDFIVIESYLLSQIYRYKISTSINVSSVPQEKDKYGNEVTKLARPLPIAYLLVDVPASTPREPLFTFPLQPARRSQFPVENR